MQRRLSFNHLSCILGVSGLCLFGASLHSIREAGRLSASRGLASDRYLEVIAITTDLMEGRFQLGVEENSSGDADNVIFRGYGPDMVWNMTQLRSGVSVPIDTVFGKLNGLVSFRSSDFDPRTGGHVTMTFPHDRLLHQELTRVMTVERSGNGWVAIGDGALGNREFHAIFLKGHFDGPLPTGIDSVSVVD